MINQYMGVAPSTFQVCRYRVPSFSRVEVLYCHDKMPALAQATKATLKNLGAVLYLLPPYRNQQKANRFFLTNCKPTTFWGDPSLGILSIWPWWVSRYPDSASWKDILENSLDSRNPAISQSATLNEIVVNKCQRRLIPLFLLKWRIAELCTT